MRGDEHCMPRPVECCSKRSALILAILSGVPHIQVGSLQGMKEQSEREKSRKVNRYFHELTLTFPNLAVYYPEIVEKCLIQFITCKVLDYDNG